LDDGGFDCCHVVVCVLVSTSAAWGAVP
jgi:hypothetical protein